MAEHKGVVIVTGGAQGMGQSHAHALAQAGWHVCVADVKDTADTVAAIIEKGGAASGHVLNVTDSKSWEALADDIRNNLGPLVGLVNNA
ncbi:MAG TPA: SDR family NAD(P)-dependent oxidoreductase, partial [Advenella sp.]|nr:SDR family NAD(P)-dependent oxidoreductase [Advenella sp.]